MSSPRPPRRLVDVFPFWGYGSVLTAVLGVIACITILVFVDGKEADQGSWKLSPNVLLSICVAIINISLHLAHTEGLNVVWWRRAQHERANPHLLHESWERADSLFMAVASVHRFDVISLATIFVAFAPIAGPFLQRSVKVYPAEFWNTTTLAFPMAERFPVGWSGYVSPKDHRPTMMSYAAVQSMYEYQLNMNVTFSDVSGCVGTCNTTIRAAGFDAVCHNTTIPWTLPLTYGSNGTLQAPIEIFGTDILFDHQQPNIIKVNTVWKDDEICSDTLWVQNCTLTASTIDYPVVLTNMFQDAAYTIMDGFIDYTREIPGADGYWPFAGTNAVHTEINSTLEGVTNTTIGGIWLALKTQFASSANIQYLGDKSYDLSFDGLISNAYLGANMTVLESASTDPCPLYWTDPSSEIVVAAQEFMLRLASKAVDPEWNPDNTVLTKQVIPNVMQIRTVSQYKSNFKYMGAALVFSCLGIMFVAPLLHGFWQLNQWGTMSPLETAKYISEAHLTPVSTSHGPPEDGKGQVVVNEREVKMS